MTSVVFDIETLGLPFDSFDEAQQEYLLKFADSEEKREAEIQKFSLTPLTARVIAVAMLNPETMAGKVFYQAAAPDAHRSADGAIEFRAGTEEDILRGFWDAVRHYDRIVTFNGRTFDCPFLMVRSAICRIRPTKNLMPYRYDAVHHCDLLDQLTFYGAMRRFNLDFYCKAFGIPSPKAQGVTGLDLGPLFEKGEYKAIAEYCLGDVVATTELFRRWNDYLNLKD